MRLAFVGLVLLAAERASDAQDVEWRVPQELLAVERAAGYESGSCESPAEVDEPFLWQPEAEIAVDPGGYDTQQGTGKEPRMRGSRTRPLSGGPGGGGGPPGYEATWYPRRSLVGQAGDFGAVRQSLGVAAPAWRGPQDMVLASFSVRNALFATDAILPDSGRPFPEQLWTINAGLNLMHEFGNGWSGGVITGIGSASDEPFQSGRELTGTLGGFLRIPSQNKRDAWQFSLMYMYGGAINFPLPLVSYAWNPSEQWSINVGLPFTVDWQPSDSWRVNLSYVPLNNIKARLTRQFSPPLFAFAGYEFLNESYLLSDRVEASERFFAFEQRVGGGFQWSPWSLAAIELHAGYSFGRNYGQGESQWSGLSDQVDVSAGAFLGLNVRIRR